MFSVFERAQSAIGHFRVALKCKVFIMKINFHSYVDKTNFHMKSFAYSLAFIMRFTATREWPVDFATATDQQYVQGKKQG